MGTSEIAKIREKIEREIEAIRAAMYGPRTAASHDMISHAYKSLDSVAIELSQYMPQDQAEKIICETYIEKMI